MFKKTAGILRHVKWIIRMVNERIKLNYKRESRSILNWYLITYLYSMNIMYAINTFKVLYIKNKYD